MHRSRKLLGLTQLFHFDEHSDKKTPPIRWVNLDLGDFSLEMTFERSIV